jgi:hypothetical protein
MSKFDHLVQFEHLASVGLSLNDIIDWRDRSIEPVRVMRSFTVLDRFLLNAR